MVLILITLSELYIQSVHLFLATLKENPTKIFFLLSLINVCTIVPLRISCNEYGEDVLTVLTILFLSFYLALYFGRYNERNDFRFKFWLLKIDFRKLYYFRGFRLTTIIVYNINTIIKEDIKKWLLIYSIFLIGFSQSLF